MKLKALAVAPLLLLIGCQAAEDLQARVIRRVQGVAVCSLLQITATGAQSAGSVPNETAAPLQLRQRASQTLNSRRPAVKRPAVSTARAFT